MLRLDLETGDPLPDNPFASSDNRRERYVSATATATSRGRGAAGTGEVYTAEHGPSNNDEVNRIEAGANYGWDPSQGGTVGGYDESVPMTDRDRFPDAVPAIWQSGRTTQAVCAAEFLEGEQWGGLEGALVVTALKGAKLLLLTLRTTARSPRCPSRGDRRAVRAPAAARLGPDGALYVTTTNGDDDRLPHAPPGPLTARRAQVSTMVVTTSVTEGERGVEEKPNRHGGSTGAQVPQRDAVEPPVSAVTVVQVGRPVELPPAGPRHPTGAHPAQERPGHRVDHRRPGGALGQRARDEAQEATQRHPAAHLEPDDERGRRHRPSARPLPPRPPGCDHLEGLDPGLVEHVGPRHEVAHLLGRCEQHPVAVGPLDHRVAERTRTGSRATTRRRPARRSLEPTPAIRPRNR